MLYTWNLHNSVHQLNPNKRKKRSSVKVPTQSGTMQRDIESQREYSLFYGFAEDTRVIAYGKKNYFVFIYF